MIIYLSLICMVVGILLAAYTSYRNNNIYIINKYPRSKTVIAIMLMLIGIVLIICVNNGIIY